MISRSHGRKFLVAAVALALLAWGVGPVTAQQQAAFDCNADIEIAFDPNASFVQGTPVGVTLTLVNGPTNGGANIPREQTWFQIDYFPSCTSTPCMVDANLPVTFDSLTSNTCGVMITATDVGVPAGTQWEFTFTPDLTLPAPPNPDCPPATVCTTECTISFDALIAPDAPEGVPTAMEARSSNIECLFPNDPNLTTSATASAVVVPVGIVPTLRGIALGILALALALGSWLILRRRTLREPGF